MMIKKTILFLILLAGGSMAYAQSGNLLTKYRAMALEYSHDLKAAEKNITASLELEKSARADRRPQLSANANFKYTGNPMELDLPLSGHPLKFQGQQANYGASVALVQPVYTGGQVLESIRLARYGQSLAANQSEVVRLAICFQTDVQYWNTVARQEIVGIVAEYQASVAALVEMIRERVEAGFIDPQDLLMAEVKLNEAHYQLLQAESHFKTGKMAFNSMIGMELNQATRIDSLIPFVFADDSVLYADGFDRPEIRMAQDRIRIAGSTLKLKDAQYKPQLYAGIEGTYSSPGYNFHKDLDPNYAVYTRLSIPVFEWGKRRSEKRISMQQIGIATDQLNQLEDEVSLEVQTAKVAFLQAQEQVILTENSLEKAAENEQKALERYHEGRTSLVEVIDAQTYRQTAQLNNVEARMTAQCHYSDLLRALGEY